jgi:hypothetical protein
MPASCSNVFNRLRVIDVPAHHDQVLGETVTPYRPPQSPRSTRNPCVSKKPLQPAPTNPPWPAPSKLRTGRSPAPARSLGHIDTLDTQA